LKGCIEFCKDQISKIKKKSLGWIISNKTILIKRLDIKYEDKIN
jgi:hypothetical protein